MVLSWGDEIALLVADVPWNALLAALNATGAGERFEAGQAIADWQRWDQEYPARHVSTRLAGEYLGRSYLFSGASTVGPGQADRVVALAATTGGLVLSHLYFDGTGTGDGVAARGDQLLRYVAEGDGIHSEGDLLAGETEEYPITSSRGFDAILTAFGFEVDTWLEHGAKWEVTWTSLDPDDGPEAVKRLYQGPVRMRSLWVEETALDEMGWRPDWWPEGGAPRPPGAPSDG